MMTKEKIQAILDSQPWTKEVVESFEALIKSLGVLVLAVLCGACDVNVNNSGDVNTGGESTSRSSSNSDFGACGDFSIVGEYEGGLEFTASCEFRYGEEAIIIQDYQELNIEDHSFRTIQSFFVDSTEEGQEDFCRVQLHNEELSVDCDFFTYEGFRLED